MHVEAVVDQLWGIHEECVSHSCGQHDHLCSRVEVKLMSRQCYTLPVDKFTMLNRAHVYTLDSECEVPSSLLSSCSCHLTGVCPSITCGSSQLHLDQISVVDQLWGTHEE